MDFDHFAESCKFHFKETDMWVYKQNTEDTENQMAMTFCAPANKVIILEIRLDND